MGWGRVQYQLIRSRSPMITRTPTLAGHFDNVSRDHHAAPYLTQLLSKLLFRNLLVDSTRYFLSETCSIIDFLEYQFNDPCRM